jgi:hypothetical protein
MLPATPTAKASILLRKNPRSIAMLAGIQELSTPRKRQISRQQNQDIAPMKANAAASENRELGREIACANSVRRASGSRRRAIHPKRRGFTSNAAPANWIATKTQRSDPDVSTGSVDTKSPIESIAVSANTTATVILATRSAVFPTAVSVPIGNGNAR